MQSLYPCILALGDSLVAGYGLTSAESFAAQLHQRLRSSFSSARVINAGESGDTTTDLLRRLPKVLSALDSRPDLAIVQIGPNDVLRQVPAARSRAQLEAVLTELGRSGIPVLLTTVAPPSFLQDRARPYLGIHEEVAAGHGAAVCPFFPAGVLGPPAMVLADRVHPNARAIADVVETMLPTIKHLLSHRRSDAA